MTGTRSAHQRSHGTVSKCEGLASKVAVTVLPPMLKVLAQHPEKKVNLLKLEGSANEH